MKKGIIALFVGIIFVLGACGNEDDIRNADENLEAGEQVFRNNCASCHGADLSGNGGPSLVDVGSKYSQEEIAEIVQNGTGGMQPQPQVEGEELEELTSWLAEQ